MEVLGIWDYVAISVNGKKFKADAGESRNIFKLCDFKMMEELYKKRADVRVLRWSEAITKNTNDAHFLDIERALDIAIKSKNLKGFEEVAHIDYNKHMFIFNDRDEDEDDDAIIYDFLEVDEFINIQKKADDDIKKRLKKSVEHLDAATADDIKKSWYYQGFLTTKQKSKTFEEQKNIIFKKLQKKSAAERVELSKKLRDVAKASELVGAVVSVEWNPSRVWGKNPRATAKIKTENGTTVLTGSPVSGCGFDKFSESIARVLNKSTSVQKILFKKFEDVLQNDPRAELRDVLGYGSGYELPEFEGGCGVSTIQNIFEACGFRFEEVANGSNFNVFEVSQKC